MIFFLFPLFPSPPTLLHKRTHTDMVYYRCIRILQGASDKTQHRHVWLCCRVNCWAVWIPIRTPVDLFALFSEAPARAASFCRKQRCSIAWILFSFLFIGFKRIGSIMQLLAEFNPHEAVRYSQSQTTYVGYDELYWNNHEIFWLLSNNCNKSLCSESGTAIPSKWTIIYCLLFRKLILK